MDKTCDLLFRVLESALFERPFKPKEGDEALWQDVDRQLRIHKLLSVAANATGLPAEAPAESWKKESWKCSREQFRLLYEESKLWELFRAHDIRFAIIKGFATSIYYPQPMLRRQNDIDFLIDRDRWDDAVCLLEENGYRPTEDTPKHLSFVKNGICYEMHRFFVSFDHGETPAEEADNMIYAGLADPVTANMDGFSFPMLPTRENGLVLLTHINLHLKYGIGLRHLTDWMMYASAVLNDEYWHSTFKPAVQKLGLEKLAAALTRICQLWLGLRTGDITWCRTAEEAACRLFINYVCLTGDIYSDPDDMQNLRSPYRTIGSVKQFFHALQEVGCITGKAIRRFPVLRPFAWLYQGIKLIFHAVRDKGGMKKAYHYYLVFFYLEKTVPEMYMHYEGDDLYL